MEEENKENIAEEMTSIKQGYEAEVPRKPEQSSDNLSPEAYPASLFYCDKCDYSTTNISALRMHKMRSHGKLRGQPRNMAPSSRARKAAAARARTARLNARGLSSRGKPKTRRKQSPLQHLYQAAHAKRQKAAREALDMTIAQFMSLPSDERAFAMKHPKQAAERHRPDRPLAKAKTAQRPSNGLVVPDDRSVKFCPHCGWNIDATRKAQAFVDGRVG